ncbi:nucleolin-like isoform X4 [Haliotis rufescens]|uniref:nucleolin-like isoform X4 n=1 Tax=Haliotis rufescens TaxID=6454 RepID=UPI00201F56F2|nr:nucleolin-like isoform X4 [Haliotis rufescens]
MKYFARTQPEVVQHVYLLLVVKTIIMARGKVGILAKSKTPQPHRAKAAVLKAPPKSAPPSKRKTCSTTESDKTPKLMELKGALFRKQEIRKKNDSFPRKPATAGTGDKHGQMSKFKHFSSPPQDDTDDDESNVDINEDDLDSVDILKDFADDSSSNDDDDDEDLADDSSSEDDDEEDDIDDGNDDYDSSDEGVGQVIEVNTKREETKATSTSKHDGNKVEKRKQQRPTVTTINKQYTDEQTIFVKNLPADTTEEDLKTLSKDIIEIRLRIALSGRRSYAYLVFSSETIAEKHYKLFQHKTLKGQSFIVDFVGRKSKVFTKGSASKQSGGPQDMKRLFVTGLGKSFTDKDLYQLFPNARETVVIRRRNGNSLGYGFVSFDNEQVAQKNLVKFKSGKTINDQRILATYAKAKEIGSNEKNGPLQVKSGADLDMKKLYLSGLGPKVSQADIEEAFPKSVNVDIINSKTDRPSPE